ncbi:MAG: M23 family metallopeptidase [Sphingomonadaceae bacterium]
MALGTAAMIAGWLGIATVGTLNPAPAADPRTGAEVARMAAQVEALKADPAARKGPAQTTAERIEQRQQFLDALVSGRAKGADLAGLLPRARGKVSAEAAANSGVLAPFAALEQRQMALTERVATTAANRLRDAHSLLARLGLDPGRFAGTTVATGSGGPFVPANPLAATDSSDAELLRTWQRAEAIEDVITSLPAYVPARNFTLTSGFGMRADPFHGRAARHAGLDLAGAHGEPILAAAAGRVVRAERFGAYGLTVDIDHGRGILTRYAHLSSIGVRVGERVMMGQQIGGMGSTGRSTGTHLHYEVRIDGQPVDPRPFIESSRYLLAYQRAPVGPQLDAALAD